MGDHITRIMACAALAAGLTLPVSAEAQLIGPRVAPAPAPPPVPAPTPDLPTPPASPAAPVVGTQAPGDAEIIHGRDLIGMQIWGPAHQQVGTVEDFVIDSQGDCPLMYLAVAPQIAGWSEGYVVVPFNAFQVGFDPALRRDFFTLNMGIDVFRRAPHVTVDRWKTLRDPQFFANSRQFYGRVERSAARPEIRGPEDRPRLAPESRPGEPSPRGVQPPPAREDERHSPPERQQPQKGPAADAPRPATTAPPAERAPEAARAAEHPQAPRQAPAPERDREHNK